VKAVDPHRHGLDPFFGVVPVGIVELTALVTREEIRTLGEAFAEMVTSKQTLHPRTAGGAFEVLWEDGVALPTPGDS
jgi:hypothetical protein